ncbi:MAG: ABC transporter ATP-binding protein [Pegethrix bostrychoides GSE-TBD4-15B]|jgi:lipopolysaccharide transport system ATP-binding protein|uniref:ABC transporter ATP-binding protein n=1 Tax=Pegethrix bostrychoides GSE-TBD4-15B TaxID=2839662 RepID=A0A951PE23_9CYAN|nr:ABC transporter ATP-binding protein [Pegethrix bostrychoides GSE-TBD4-15B]
MIDLNVTSPTSLPQSESDTVLVVEGISKKFCRSLKQSMFYGLQDMGAELTGRRQAEFKLRPKEFWALQDISFTLQRGEAIGLVGANGSGKTTLLRMISGLIRPDTGSIWVKGRVAPLIALGAGFSPILTGRENIYANMSILGLSTQEIEARFEQVVAFAEIDEAIDAPVQSYSSGMAARLGFACAIHTDPDVLLIDEVLAVGDARFRSKCERRLAELLQNGTSFVLVSHFFQGILNTCQKGLYLSKGQLVACGSAREIMDRYEEELFSVRQTATRFPFYFPVKSEAKPEAKPVAEQAQPDATNRTGAELVSLHFEDAAGQLVESPVSGEPLSICVRCRGSRAIGALSLFVAIYLPAKDNSLMLHLSSAYDQETFAVTAGDYELRVKLPHLGLLPAAYTLSVYLKDGSLYVLDAYESIRFSVTGKEKLNRGQYYQPHNWQISPAADL